MSDAEIRRLLRIGVRDAAPMWPLEHFTVTTHERVNAQPSSTRLKQDPAASSRRDRSELP